MKKKEMENGEMEHMGGVCGCACSACRVGHHHWGVRILFIIVAFCAAFWLGMKFGEIKMLLHSDSRGWSGMEQDRFMMRGGYGYETRMVPAVPAPSTPAPSPAPAQE